MYLTYVPAGVTLNSAKLRHRGVHSVSARAIFQLDSWRNGCEYHADVRGKVVKGGSKDIESPNNARKRGKASRKIDAKNKKYCLAV